MAKRSVFRFGVGCCCGPTGCGIASDDFNRSNNSNINTGAPFTWGINVTGTFFPTPNIFGSRLAFFYDLTGRLTCPTASPDGSGVVSCTFETSTDGEWVEVWLNGTDDENCIVARLTTDSSAATLDIISRIANADTVLETGSVTAAPGVHTLRLYYDAAAETALAIVDDDPDSTLCAGVDAIGDLSGISIGDHTETDIYADDFSYAKISDGENGCEELPGCPTTNCNDGGGTTEEKYLRCCRVVPQFLDVTIPAGTFVNDKCHSCTSIAGTYTVERNISTPVSPAVAYAWRFYQANLCVVSSGSATRAHLDIELTMTCNGDTCNWAVAVNIVPGIATGPFSGLGSDTVIWALSGEITAFPCGSASHVFPFNTKIRSGGWALCDAITSPSPVTVGPH